MADTGDMSIHASSKRFRSKRNLPIQSAMSMFALLARINLKKSPEENTLSSLDEMVSQRISKILDAIFCPQRFSTEKSLIHFCISVKSVLQCQSSSTFFKHCKIHPIIKKLLILETRTWPIKEWWNFSSNSTCSFPLICWFCAICSNDRFGRFV